MKSDTRIGIILLTISVMVFFYKTIFFGQIPAPTDALHNLYYPWRDIYLETNPRGIPFKNFLITDPVRQQIPWRKLVADSLKAGKLAGWNPYALAGYSLSGNIQAAPFFPGNLLFLVIRFPVAWSVLIVLSHLVAAVSMFTLGRTLGRSVAASVLGGLAYAFSGFMVSWSQWNTLVWTAAFIPWALVGVNRYFKETFRRGNFIWPFMTALFLALSFLSGHTQIFFYGWLITFFYALSFVIGKDTGLIKKFSIFLILNTLFLILLTWYQWSPLLQTFSGSGRVAGPELPGEGWYFPWSHLVQFLAPDFFGNPATLNYRGVWNYGEFNGYTGIVMLVFATAAVFSRSLSGRFFRLLLPAALILMTENPLTRLLAGFNIPVYGSLQPSRLVIVAVLALVILGMEGFDIIRKSAASSAMRNFLPTGAVLVCLTLAAAVLSQTGDPESAAGWTVTLRNLVVPGAVFTVSGAVFIIANRVRTKPVLVRNLQRLIVLIVFLDLLRMGWKFLPFTPQVLFFPETRLTSFLSENQGEYRSISVDPDILPPNTASYYGIRMLDGYDSLVPARTEEYLAAAARNRPDITRPFGFNRIIASRNPYSPLYKIASVKYVLTKSALVIPELQPVTTIGSVNVYEITGSAPSYYLAEEIDVADSKEETMRLLFTDFKPGESAVVEVPIDNMPEPGNSGSVEHIEKGHDRLEYRVRAGAGGALLVITESFDAGWQAAVDGIITPVIRANYAFMAITVPAGSHRVTIKRSGGI